MNLKFAVGLNFSSLNSYKFLLKYKNSLGLVKLAMADPGFARQGAPTPKVEPPIYYFAQFSTKTA